MTSQTCLACGGTELEHVADLGTSPVSTGALHAAAEEARAVRRGQLDLVGCRTCGHVANRVFDPALVDYDASYDNSLHFSPAFQQYADALANRLVTSYGLAGKHIVEIGSGRGDFLSTLARRSGGTATGYDPSYTGSDAPEGVTLIPEYFTPDRHLDSYDLLVCRHVLEHLDAPHAMLSGIRAGGSAHAVHYVEVPSAEFCFGPSGLWDCIYPHVSYFSRTSLRCLLERSGFEVLDEGAAFDGQFLWVEAKPSEGEAGRPDAEEVAMHLERLRAFGLRWHGAVTRWRETLTTANGSSSNGSVRALWGAGAKAVTFLNAVDGCGRLWVVDLNPRKWGRHLPGTAHMVRPPESLAGQNVPEVLITNAVYRNEIATYLERIGVSTAIVAV